MNTERRLFDPWPLSAERRASDGRSSHVPGPVRTIVVPPVRTIVLDREPTAVAPPQERESIRQALAAQGPERLRLDDVSIYYGGKRAVNSVSMSIHQGEVLALIGPSGCGKTSLLRTLNRLTELTPSASRSGVDHARRPGRPRLAGHKAALASGDGLPAAQPLPDVDLRQRGLCLARTVAQEAAPARAGAAGDRCAAASGTLRRGRRRPRPSRATPLRRPAAKAVHRTRDRDAPRGAA